MKTLFLALGLTAATLAAAAPVDAQRYGHRHEYRHGYGRYSHYRHGYYRHGYYRHHGYNGHRYRYGGYRHHGYRHHY